MSDFGIWIVFRCFIAIVAIAIVCCSTTASDRKQRGRAAWAWASCQVTLDNSKQPKKVVPSQTTKKGCPCSTECVCGCNQGKQCDCNSSTKQPLKSVGYFSGQLKVATPIKSATCITGT